MYDIRFVWDEKKADGNIKKHGISFEEAKTVFFDEQGLEYFDPDNSEEEDRFLLLGMSLTALLLVVCHCAQEANDVIRIISARKATSFETSRYEKEMI